MVGESVVLGTADVGDAFDLSKVVKGEVLLIWDTVTGNSDFAVLVFSTVVAGEILLL